jgi:hypothetical protein
VTQPGLMIVGGTGVSVPVDPRDRIAEFERPGEHLWTAVAIYRIDPAAWVAFGARTHLDTENLLTIAGPGCFKCEQPYSPELAARRCPGDVG